MNNDQIEAMAREVCSAFDGEGTGWSEHYRDRIAAILRKRLTPPASPVRTSWWLLETTDQSHRYLVCGADSPPHMTSDPFEASRFDTREEALLAMPYVGVRAVCDIPKVHPVEHAFPPPASESSPRAPLTKRLDRLYEAGGKAWEHVAANAAQELVDGNESLDYDEVKAVVLKHVSEAFRAAANIEAETPITVGASVERPTITYDPRVGCVAVYLGTQRQCLDGMDRDPACLFYAHGKWHEHTGWSVDEWDIARARAIHAAVSKLVAIHWPASRVTELERQLAERDAELFKLKQEKQEC